ncbi:methyltransferase domain-containing protein [Sarocladium implicatum]|nr:methyltransferase domain-containing protein [Sarocladium implicatum]
MDLIEARNWAYIPTPTSDVDSSRRLLERYSNVPASLVDSHIQSVVSYQQTALVSDLLTALQRDVAWEISRLPYIGRWKFLRLLDCHDSRYKQTLFRLRLANSRDAVLDLGCCVAPFLRQLCAEGIPGRQLYGTDIEPRFFDLGYELFRDRKSLGATFVPGDMLDFDDTRLHALHGKVTIIHASSFFHLFNRIQQLGIGKRLVSFIKPGTTNALIFGRQMGVMKPGGARGHQRSTAFLHNETSFQELWDEIGELTGTRWSVMFDHRPEDAGVLDDSPRPIEFTVYQIP